MQILNNIEVEDAVIKANLTRIRNQIFACLPKREEEGDYIKPLETLTVELLGFSTLLETEPSLFSLTCKLKGLQEGGDEIDFMLYRRTIFEACGMVNNLIAACE